MLLSVLVPVYNVEKYVARCIDSLLSQTYRDIEIVLVDDGSTDKSGYICDVYAKSDTRIKVIHKDNGGLSSARCAGLMASTGEYVAFVDSDDYVDSDMFAQLMEPILEDDGVDISLGGHVINKIDGGIVNIFTDRTSEIYYDFVEAMADMFEGKKFIWSLCGKVYKRELFIQDALMANWPSSHGEDTYANSMVFPIAKKMVFVPVYGYHYCMRSDSMMNNSFNVGKLVSIDIVTSLMKKYSDNSLRLFNALGNLMVNLSIVYLKAMLSEYPKYKSFISKYQVNLSMWYDCIELDVQQNYAIQIVLKKPYEYLKWKTNWERKIFSFCNSSGIHETYIYGTGAYGQATLDLLEVMGIKIAGFIETNPVKKTYKNYFVYKVDDIAIGSFVIIAMNYNNTLLVEDVVKAKEMTALYVWQYFLIV